MVLHVGDGKNAASSSGLNEALAQVSQGVRHVPALETFRVSLDGLLSNLI